MKIPHGSEFSPKLHSWTHLPVVMLMREDDGSSPGSMLNLKHCRSVPSMTLIFTNRRDQIMKTAKVGSEEIIQAIQTRPVAGVRVRSGIKAGKRWDAGNVGGGFDPGRGGGGRGGGGGGFWGPEIR
jgi:hypothetical protein